MAFGGISEGRNYSSNSDTYSPVTSTQRADIQRTQAPRKEGRFKVSFGRDTTRGESQTRRLADWKRSGYGSRL